MISCNSCGAEFNAEDVGYKDICPVCYGEINRTVGGQCECMDEDCGWIGLWIETESVEVCPECGKDI
jgi:hypothetical protein